jgi:hypothetical protein
MVGVAISIAISGFVSARRFEEVPLRPAPHQPPADVPAASNRVLITAAIISWSQRKGPRPSVQMTCIWVSKAPLRRRCTEWKNASGEPGFGFGRANRPGFVNASAVFSVPGMRL